MKVNSKNSGKLPIGDDWNAIRIIALSQSNPLKAIAEFVENSIDAHAKMITITRGKEHNVNHLAIKDDGDGVPRDTDGLPDFKYVATHICDSIVSLFHNCASRPDSQTGSEAPTGNRPVSPAAPSIISRFHPSLCPPSGAAMSDSQKNHDYFPL